MYKTVLQNISWLTVQEIIFNGFGIIFYVLLARYLGESGLGIYSYTLSFTAFFGLLLDFGVNSYTLREWTSTEQSPKSFIPELLAVKLSLAFFFSLFFVPYLWIFERNIFIYFLLAYLGVLVDTFRVIPLMYLQSTSRFKTYVFMNSIEKIFSILGGIVLLIFTQNLVYVFSFLLLGKIVSLLFANSYFSIVHWPQFGVQKIKTIIQVSTPLFLFTFLNSIYFKIDTVMIGKLLDLDQVGLYNSAYRLIETMTLIPALVCAAFLPSLRRLIIDDHKTEISKVLSKVTKYLTLVTVLSSIIFAFYSGEILHFLYGARYIDARNILVILGLTLIPLFMNSWLTYYLFARKQDSFLLRRVLFLVCFNVVFNFIFIPQIGVLGAAIATLVTEIISSIILMYSLKDLLQWSWVPPLMLVGGVNLTFFTFFHPPLFPALFLSGGIYCLVLILFKVIRIEEIKILISSEKNLT